MEQILNTILFAVTVLTAIALIRQNSKQKLSGRSWMFSLLAIMFIPFGMAWWITSCYEGEMQAAWVGFFVFSGLGIVSGILAWREMFPKAKIDKVKAQINDKLGLKITIMALLIIGIMGLPLSLFVRNVLNSFTNKDAAVEILTQKVLADKALPFFAKKTLAYETYYGEFPEELSQRMMQSMMSGVENEKMIALFDMIIPEIERIELLNNGADAISNWLQSDAAYPQMEIAPKLFLTRVNENAEELIRWLYSNFHFPPMNDTTVANFEAGIFSSNIKDYIGTPPEQIKESLIVPFANLIRSQIDSLEVPVNLSLSETLSKKVPADDIKAKKAKIKQVVGLTTNLWIVFSLFIIAGIILIFIGKLNLIKWLSGMALVFGFRLVLCVNMFGDAESFVQDLIPQLAEKAPAPVLALINFILPDLIAPIGNSFKVWMIVLLITGIAGLFIANRKKLLKVLSK